MQVGAAAGAASAATNEKEAIDHAGDQRAGTVGTVSATGMGVVPGSLGRGGAVSLPQADDGPSQDAEPIGPLCPR